MEWGSVGEVVTNNGVSFENVPRHVLHIREHWSSCGEAIIPYSDFYKMNEEIEDVDSQYKNPRNFMQCSCQTKVEQ